MLIDVYNAVIQVQFTAWYWLPIHPNLDLDLDHNYRSSTLVHPRNTEASYGGRWYTVITLHKLASVCHKKTKVMQIYAKQLSTHTDKP